jgi:accessory gene regulator protein AgrB
MREWFVNTNINYITAKNNYDERRIKIIKYGLECIYTTITKSSVIVLLSIILNIFYETLLLIILLYFIKNIWLWHPRNI